MLRIRAKIEIHGNAEPYIGEKLNIMLLLSLKYIIVRYKKMKAMKTKCNSINVKLACWLATFHSSEAILFHVKTKVRQK